MRPGTVCVPEGCLHLLAKCSSRRSFQRAIGQFGKARASPLHARMMAAATNRSSRDDGAAGEVRRRGRRRIFGDGVVALVSLAVALVASVSVCARRFVFDRRYASLDAMSPLCDRAAACTHIAPDRVHVISFRRISHVRRTLHGRACVRAWRTCAVRVHEHHSMSHRNPYSMHVR